MCEFSANEADMNIREEIVAQNFDVNKYWLKRGQTYANEERLALDYHRHQEQFLIEILAASRIPMGRLLEIGCGFGRITSLLAKAFPQSQITALDLSPDQLANARKHCGPASNITFEQYDFYSELPFPGTDYDAVIAVEVFLHHPPEIVQGLIGRLSEISPFIVSIDWNEEWPWKLPEHVWMHDFKAFYAQAGWPCATFAIPEKVEGMQQKLLIGGRQLTPELQELEQTCLAASMNARLSEQAETSVGNRPWSVSMQLAIQELLALIPAGHSFILVDEEHWGNPSELASRSVLPFLEREGRYWGLPPDDSVAIRELERLRGAGAGFIVFAWDCFWWLKHYGRFHAYLRATYPCRIENDRLIVFKLGS